jgi:hypothetical protein
MEMPQRPRPRTSHPQNCCGADAPAIGIDAVVVVVVVVAVVFVSVIVKM